MQSVSQDVLVERFGRSIALSDAACRALRRIPLTRRNLDTSDYLVREADAPDTCIVILSGYAFRQKITGQGARQITSICMPGDVVDLANLYLDVADHSIQMLSDGEVVTFPRTALRDAIEGHADIARAAMIELALGAAIMREWITNNGQRPAKMRLAHLLCEIAVRHNARSDEEEMQYEMPMNQEHLGDMLGLTSAHVNRMLRELGEEGLVVWTKRSVRLPDWRKLRTVADFNRRYLHLDLGVASTGACATTDRTGG